MKLWQAFLVALAVGSAGAEAAETTRYDLTTQNDIYVTSNASGQISGSNLHTLLQNLIDSAAILQSDNIWTAPMTIQGAGPTISFDRTTSVGASLFGKKGGLPRWLIALGDGTAEAGANAGSDFSISRYSDAGVLIDSPLSIVRSTGVISSPTAINISTKLSGYRIENVVALSANFDFGALAIGSPTASTWMNGLVATSNTVAIGKGSLGLNTTGTNNVAVGAGAAASNTTGHDNTVVGNFAGYFTTTGFYNTAVGGGAVFNNTTGLEIIGVGFNAAAGNVGGSFNIGVGNASLNLSQNDSQNVGVGHHSMYVLNGGSFNTGVGNNSLALLTTGGNNTTIGYGSGSSFTTGGNNVAIGLNSGALATTGNNNTFVGAQGAANGITTGSNNTILGANITGLATGLTGAIIFSDGAGAIKLDFGSSAAAAWTSAAPVRLPTYTVAGLPACVAALTNAMAVVSDATAPTYNAALVGVGAVRVPVFCDGTAWTSH